MKRMMIAALTPVLVACPESQRHDRAAPDIGPAKAAVERTMAEARQAIASAGETEAAMERIRAALAELAREPGLRAYAPLSLLHGSSRMRSGMLASDGDEGISLFIVHFARNVLTPPHDHLTWGVVHVLEGRDTYIPFERIRGGRAGLDLHAPVRRGAELVLGPGESTYWLPPPDDVHSQKTDDADVWELVIAGKNLLGEGVTRHRHYFDPETGRVIEGPPH